jgi:hypothetical protein
MLWYRLLEPPVKTSLPNAQANDKDRKFEQAEKQ